MAYGHTPSGYKFPSDRFGVVGGILSPVSDGYKKQGLAPAHHRVEMCKLAAEDEYNWLTVDPWEAESPSTIPTAQVLDHVDHEINEVMGGIDCDDGTKRRAKIVLLAGLDLVQTMSTPGVWEKRDLDRILGRYGLFALERRGTETEPALASLKQWRNNIHILRKMQHVTEDISSTKTRLLLKQDEVKRLDQQPNGDRSSPSLDDMLVLPLDNSNLL
ncbi:Nicotinamide/nicotinic acid mononucleotide adenylyltransferase 1 [Fusarium falciforme]|uniref:Nicotinamide/nicotinic acid mononucleotide adenylyltransferase 1 n=1 Tax=Fusarium falciforme TaxID=195108 RepID=A0A9W8V4R6_9HYPO|nr:Nicotinamide/nicotinic acid mononucleotide adenylyltransferase 1 [Fusarium falciforme]